MALQRKHCHKGTLSESRTKLLDDINFVWSTEKHKLPLLTIGQPTVVPQSMPTPAALMGLFQIPFVSNFILPSELTQLKPLLDTPAAQSPLVFLEQEKVEKREQLG